MPCSRSASSPSTSSALQRRKLVVEDQLFLVKHPPDQGGLAVVDRPAGQETKRREGRRINRDIHQK
jgi:hypothetical protein